MEKGSQQTLIGKWLEASSILGRLDGWQELLAPKEDLFAKFKKKTVRDSVPVEGERKRHDAHGMVDSVCIGSC
jgi:hypothetical protein